MFRDDPHPTEEELLLVVDGEISRRRASKVRAHLTACWDCRARMAEIENTIADFVRIHHQSTDLPLPPAAGPRALLRSRLAELASRTHSDSWHRFFHFGRVMRVGVYGALVILLTILGGEAIYRQFALRTPGSAIMMFRPGAEPDRKLTPGATRQVTLNDVCSVAHEEVVKPVPSSMREQVFREYGIVNPNPNDYEIDYLIAPGLGGLEDIHNLWPEPNASVAWNSHAKDELEERLHELVCSGKVDLATAQHDIATDWIAAYKKYLLTRTAFPQDADPPGNKVASRGAF